MVSITPKFEISFSSHREYHLYYLTKHTNQWCRRLHFAGSIAGVIGAVAGVARLDVVTVGASAVVGAAIAWAGDYFCQKETPMAFKHPLWSVMSNFKMVAAMLRGDMSI